MAVFDYRTSDFKSDHNIDVAGAQALLFRGRRAENRSMCVSHHPSVPADVRQIMDDLSTRQFLSPHTPLSAVLEAAGAALGFELDIADPAVVHLGLDGGASVGRLRRSELAALAGRIGNALHAEADSSPILSNK